MMVKEYWKVIGPWNMSGWGPGRTVHSSVFLARTHAESTGGKAPAGIITWTPHANINNTHYVCMCGHPFANALHRTYFIVYVASCRLMALLLSSLFKFYTKLCTLPLFSHTNPRTATQDNHAAGMPMIDTNFFTYECTTYLSNNMNEHILCISTR